MLIWNIEIILNERIIMIKKIVIILILIVIIKRVKFNIIHWNI